MDGKRKIQIFRLVLSLVVLSVLLLSFQSTKTKQNSVAQKEVPAVAQVEPPPAETTHEKAEPDIKIPSAVPIFMYHYIREYIDSSDPIGVNLSVSPKKFEEQLAWLKENGYQTVFPAYFKNPEPMAAKPIILTFDDGYQDAFDSAFLLLQKYQLAGMFYLIVNKIGTPGYLSWEEISEMQKAGMSFGSHTLTHPDLRKLSAASLEKEIQESKTILEQKLGQQITDFCYPSGKYDDAVLQELKKANYQTAVTTNSGISHLKDDPFLLKRLRITEKTDIQAILSAAL